jgi:hypothetical protein
MAVLQSGGVDAVRDWLRKRHPQAFAPSSSSNHAP